MARWRGGGKKRHKRRPCPWCGEMIAIDAPGCPVCGSEERTGWKEPEEIEAASVEIPECDMNEADYEAYLRRDPETRNETGQATSAGNWIGGALLAGLLIYVISKLIGLIK